VPSTTALTAIKKLELSQLDPTQVQREMMGKDLDLDKLNVYLKSAIIFDSTDRVIDINVNRTIDGASSVDVDLNDYDRSLLRSGAINTRLDIEIDGLWFRLVKVSRDAGSDILKLTFEQREIAVLRSYPKSGAPHNGVKFANRDKTTRAEFILNLIREVKEFKIPVVMPHLRQVQEIAKATDSTSNMFSIKGSNSTNGDGGIPPDINSHVPEKAAERQLPSSALITVKGDRIANDQINNANMIISAGLGMKPTPANRTCLVCAIMTVIQESTLHNLTGGDGTSVGLFQQTDTGWGSYEDRHDPVTASRSFFKILIPLEAKVGSYTSYNDLCQDVQRSGHPDLYGQHRDEAERIVSAYGLPPGAGGDASTTGDSATANNMAQDWAGVDSGYYYWRGLPPVAGGVWKREDSWTCIKRLADEVGWRAFFISGVFYFLTDDDLFKMQPVATITESTKGVMGIGFDYDIGKKAATVDIPAMVGLWLAPPGAIVVLQEMGPLDGRWIVNTFARSLFSDNADINLSKPQPKLKEPTTESQTLPTWAGGHPAVSTQDPALFGEGMPGHGIVVQGGMSPKNIIDTIVVPIAQKHGMVTGIDPQAIVTANAAHGPTVSGGTSDHQGPPEFAWASDMSNGQAPTPQMDALAKDLGITFGIPWPGSGLVSKTKDGYRYQLIYRTMEGGNHFNHVHFGVRIVS
jgi:hypothetical protein